MRFQSLMISMSGCKLILRVFLVYIKKSHGFRKILSLVRFLLDFNKILKFVSEAKEFLELGGDIRRLTPHLNESGNFAGSFHGQYFWQDLIVAQWVVKQSKERLLDVGSRIDGYVAHVATSQKISVIDLRPITKEIPNVRYFREDILKYRSKEKFEIVTSLHTIEHIGLGRYGDDIDPHGHEKAFASLSNFTELGGFLIVSFPISRETEVEFNGQRRIGFREPLVWGNKLKLQFTQLLHLNSEDSLRVYVTEDSMKAFLPDSGNLGIYFFRKVEN
jgi:hypothetical protein